MATALRIALHVISRRPFSNAARLYRNDAAAIDRVYKVLRAGSFSDPEELRKIFPSLDNFKYKDKWWVIDIGGNNLRLLAFIQFRDNRIYVKHIVTHREYDRLCIQYAREAR